MAKESVQPASAETPVESIGATALSALPREPLISAEQAEDDKKISAAKLRALLNFHLHGDRDPASDSDTAKLWPALLHPFRDMRSIRYEYPLLVPLSPQQHAVQSLATRVDEIIDQSGPDGDPKERLRRHAYQFEAGLKDALEQSTSASLATLARQVRDQLLEAASLEESRKNILRQDFDIIISGLPLDVEITGCTENLAPILYRSIARQHWADQCTQWQGELEQLVHGLGGILGADAERKPEARSSDHLRNMLGSGKRDDLDFDRMAAILSTASRGEPLPMERQKRVSDALDILKAMLPVYGIDSDLEPPFDPDLHVDTLGEAVVQLNLRQIAMVDFFRALRVAELELGNHYSAAVHDEFFKQFSYSHLSEEERALCPPVVVELTQQGLDPSTAAALLELLDSDARIRIILQLNALDEDEFSGSPAWPARLGGCAISLGSAFVFQGTSSTPDALREAFAAGAGFPGPALFSVYTGSAEGSSCLPAYLQAASALESRALPCYRFDPSLGPDQASRMVLMNNPQPELSWVSDIFSFFNSSGQESAMELTFSHADFLLADSRWQDQFWLLEHAFNSDALLPLDEFLALEKSQQVNRIPYVLAVDGNNEIRRVVINYRVLKQVHSVANRWRAVQEAGGIHNSHALSLMASEQAKMESELQAGMDALQEQTDSQLEQNLGELTREIVTRIADQLISGASASGAVPASPTPVRRSEAAAPVAAPQEEVAAPAEEAEEDEAPISLDEPYIDTPLCTTCDDCTKMAAHIFAYDENKQAYIKDATAGTFQEMVLAAEKCPVSIIHPGKPKNPAEKNLDEWIARAKPFN